VVLEYGGALVTCDELLVESLVELGEHLLDHVFHGGDRALHEVDLLVVLALGEHNVLEGLAAHGNVVLAVAVVHDIHGHVVYDARVVLPDIVRVEAVERVDDADVDGVHAVLADVGDHVGHAHDASLERRGAQALDGRHVGRAELDGLVELLERLHVAQAKHLLRELAVVAERAVKRLEAYVAPVELVHNAHRMHVMPEAAPRMALEALAQVALARVAERRVAQVVPERNGLDELCVKAEQVAYAARNAAHELHVQPAAADVVVLDEREHLRLVRIAVVRGNVDDLLDIAREGGARDRGLVMGLGLPAEHVFVGECVGVLPASRTVLADG